MIKPAQNYVNEIRKNYADHMYDLDYQFYYGFRGTELPKIEDKNYDSYQFASVDKNDNVIGYISYNVDLSANSCYNFGIMSFDRGNIVFPRDIKQVIDDIFYKYNFDRISFNCFSGNPVLRSYRKFIQKHGGREVGTFKRCARLLDGKLYDSIAFEILKEDYIR